MAWEGERFGIAFACERVDLRAAWIAQSQQTRGFIVGFAGGVVARAADDAHLRCRTDFDELRMAAGDEEREERIWRRFVAVEEGCEDVAVQMVDGVERFA